MAEEVFDRCIDFNREQDFKDPDLEITFDFQYLDDTYSAATWGDPKKVKVKNSHSKWNVVLVRPYLTCMTVTVSNKKNIYKNFLENV